MKIAVRRAKPIRRPPGVCVPPQPGKPAHGPHSPECRRRKGDTPVARLNLSPTDAALAQIPVDDATRSAADEIAAAAYAEWWLWELLHGE